MSCMMMMFINKIPGFCIASHTSETNINKNQQEIVEMTAFNPVNILVMKSKITKHVPFPPSSTNLRGKQIRMSDLYLAHKKIEITPGEKFQYQ